MSIEKRDIFIKRKSKAKSFLTVSFIMAAVIFVYLFIK